MVTAWSLTSEANSGRLSLTVTQQAATQGLRLLSIYRCRFSWVCLVSYISQRPTTRLGGESASHRMSVLHPFLTTDILCYEDNNSG
jgi:hypothetical protein